MIQANGDQSAQAILDRLPCGYLQICGTGLSEIRAVNQTFADWVKRPLNSLIGQPVTLIMPKSSSLFFHSQALPQTKLGGNLEECYFKLLNQAGDRFPVLANISYHPAEEQAGTQDVYNITLTRIEKRHRLEEAYVQAKQEAERIMVDLQRSNEVLSRFAGMVAHDLKSPIRHMGNLSQFIIEDYGPALDEPGQALLERLDRAAKRSTYFIDKLLEYGSLSLSNQTRSPIDLNQTLAVVQENLQSLIEEAQAQIEIQKLPVVSGLDVQLEQLFQNLLSNAIKYQNPHCKPQIKVYTDDINSDFCKIWVEDNGIGIDAGAQRKIFDILHRLHNPNIEGNGIGLATCKWIVQNHGGNIGVESTPGKGSRFYITLTNVKSEGGS